jgi:hypothetical protein
MDLDGSGLDRMCWLCWCVLDLSLSLKWLISGVVNKLADMYLFPGSSSVVIFGAAVVSGLATIYGRYARGGTLPAMLPGILFQLPVSVLTDMAVSAQLSLPTDSIFSCLSLSQIKELWFLTYFIF